MVILTSNPTKNVAQSQKCRKITEFPRYHGPSVPPALPNEHENTSKASRAFTLRPHLMRLGAGAELVFVFVFNAQGLFSCVYFLPCACWNAVPWPCIFLLWNAFLFAARMFFSQTMHKVYSRVFTSSTCACFPRLPTDLDSFLG